MRVEGGVLSCDIDACMPGLKRWWETLNKDPALSEGPYFPCRLSGRALDRTKPGTSSEARYKHREVESGTEDKGADVPFGLAVTGGKNATSLLLFRLISGSLDVALCTKCGFL